jgi:D-alanyl-D-alanine carboxypeptidase/D-alanyl-D-alanine-endopeptidase (penicillin-binding protein 4)
MAKNLVIGFLSAALVVSLIVHLLPDGPETPPSTPVAIEPVPVAPPQPVESATTPVPPVTPEPVVEPEPPVDPLVAALTKAFDAAAEQPGLAGAAIGFCLIGPDGEVVYAREAETAQIPASSLKTLTTATALEVLGPEFVFETRLGISAPKPTTIAPSKPEADLVLVGGGDPMLSIKDFEAWAKGLVEAGVQAIPGRVIGDGRVFTGSLFGDFWNWGDIGNGYGSPVAGLNLGHNRFTAVFAPGEKAGDPAKFLGAFPEVPGVSWWNESLTSEEGTGDGIVIHGGERTAVMHLRGTVPLGGELEVTGAVPDPERFAAHHLRETLIAAGIQVAGTAVAAGELTLKGEAVPEIAEELLVHRSPPLIEIVKSIHEHSDNHETECVYRTLGLQAGLPPDEVIRRHWRQRGLELTGLRMVDGSGLARADHISPASLARLQHFAAEGPAGESYVGSLLDFGEGRLRFKAGAMSSVRSYTGLIQMESGLHAFALMLNHYPDGAAVNELQREVFGILLGPEESEPEPADPEPQPAAPEAPAPAPAPVETPSPAATPVPQ